jgi:hypothetical protein
MKLEDQTAYETRKRQGVQPTSLRTLPKALNVELSEIALEEDDEI